MEKGRLKMTNTYVFAKRNLRLPRFAFVLCAPQHSVTEITKISWLDRKRKLSCWDCIQAEHCKFHINFCYCFERRFVAHTSFSHGASPPRNHEQRSHSAFKTLNGRLDSILEEIREVRNLNELLCERIKRLEITKSEREELPSSGRGR